MDELVEQELVEEVREIRKESPALATLKYSAAGC